jgi:hypothetical protein
MLTYNIIKNTKEVMDLGMGKRSALARGAQHPSSLTLSKPGYLVNEIMSLERVAAKQSGEVKIPG